MLRILGMVNTRQNYYLSNVAFFISFIGNSDTLLERKVKR